MEIDEPQLLYAAREVLDPRTWRVGEHVHRHHELLVMQRGYQRTRIHSVELEAGPGEVLFYRAGTPHEEWLLHDESVVKYTIGFDWAIDLSDVPHKFSDGKGRLAEIADWITTEVPHGGTLNPTLREPLLHGLVGELRRAAEGSGKELREKALRLTREGLREIRSVEDLAKAMGMSRSHLSRRFADETGQSPSDFLRAERLQRARYLFRSTRMPVKEVAEAVGVGNAQQLCRMIRQSFGVTTRELRTSLVK